MKPQSTVTLAAALLEMAGEKAPFYQGCGCGIVIDASINCCLLKCHDVGFLPHFQLQRTADGRGRNNEDPFLTLRLKNLATPFSQTVLLTIMNGIFEILFWKLQLLYFIPSIIPQRFHDVCNREQTRTG